jgi:methionyl-tRNA formyltransferase
MRIGVIGTLNGLRMRRWYGQDLAERLAIPDIETAARNARVPILRISTFRDPQAQEAVRALELDVAVSMGNGYIVRGFYEIPRFGMINIHHELLPEYRGAQTALWQIYHGSSITGYSIHEISSAIDAGRILYRERVPITVCNTLRETVITTSADVQRRSLNGLTQVLGRFEDYRASSSSNDAQNSYTTPGTKALIRIVLNHRRLRRQVTANGATTP